MSTERSLRREQVEALTELGYGVTVVHKIESPAFSIRTRIADMRYVRRGVGRNVTYDEILRLPAIRPSARAFGL